MVCRHSLSVFDHSSCRAILKTTTTMVMATNTKPQTHITMTSIIKAIMTIRNIRSMASNRKYMGTTIKGMGTVVTMMSRQFAFLHIGGRFTNECRGYYNADATNQYHQDGGYYEGHQHGYQDEYYNDQYYDQGTPAAGQQPHYSQGGYGFVSFYFVSGSCLRSAEPSQSAVVTIQRKTRRPSATSL